MKGMEYLPLTRQRLTVPGEPFLGGGNIPDMGTVILTNDADAILAAQNDLVPPKAYKSRMTGRGGRPAHCSAISITTGDLFVFREDQRIGWARRFHQYKALA